MLDIVLCLTLTQYKVFDTVFEHKKAMYALDQTGGGEACRALQTPSTGRLRRGKLPPQTRTAPQNIFCKFPPMQKTMLCYRKDDRAMRPIYGCLENFRDSHSNFSQNFSWVFVPIDNVNVRTKFEVST